MRALLLIAVLITGSLTSVAMANQPDYSFAEAKKKIEELIETTGAETVGVSVQQQTDRRDLRNGLSVIGEFKAGSLGKLISLKKAINDHSLISLGFCLRIFVAF